MRVMHTKRATVNKKTRHKAGLSVNFLYCPIVAMSFSYPFSMLITLSP